MQQHLLLLSHDSVENKKKIDELSTKNQLLTNELKNDSVEHKRRIDEFFTENKRLSKQLKDDSVEHKKRIDELFTENKRLNQQLKDDSVEHKRSIDEFFTENKRLNQQLKETKADLNLFKENDEKTSDEQIISKLLDQCVTDVCNDFNKILMERYNAYLQKGNEIASTNINNSLLRKFFSLEEKFTEPEVQKDIDQFSKELHEINLVDDFIQDEILHACKQNKINSIDDLNKIKTILPNSCWKGANEKMKRCVEICCNFEQMKQGMKFDNYIEGKVAASKQRLEQYRSLLQQGNKCLCLDGYNYYQITLASLPVTRYVNSVNNSARLTITFSAQNNVISFSFKSGIYSHPVLMEAEGHQLNLKCVEEYKEYICEQSINKLKDMGYIVNDGFVLRIPW